jgi:hypothetical protein
VKYLFIFIILILLFVSCSVFEEKETKAYVNKNYIYLKRYGDGTASIEGSWKITVKNCEATNFDLIVKLYENAYDNSTGECAIELNSFTIYPIKGETFPADYAEDYYGYYQWTPQTGTECLQYAWTYEYNYNKC